MSLKKYAILAAAAAFAVPAAANAAFYTLGTSSTGGLPGSNPSLDVTAGQSVTLFIWADTTNGSDNYLSAGNFGIQYSGNLTLTGANASGQAIQWVSAANGGFNTTPTQIGSGTAPTASGNFRTMTGLSSLINARGYSFASAANSGVTTGNPARPIASFTFTVSPSATAGQSASIFIVTGNTGMFESPATGSDTNFIGYNGANRDGQAVNQAGTNVNADASAGFLSTQSSHVRTAVADATLQIAQPVVTDKFNITAGGTAAADVNVGGSLANGYSLTPVPAANGLNAFSFDAVFANGTPGSVIVAVNLVGNTAGAILGLSPVAESGLEGVLAGFQFFKSIPGVAGQSTYNVDIDLPTGVTIGSLAVIPEPSVIGLLAPLGLLAARRRK